MPDLSQTLDFIYRGEATKRFHTVRTLQTDSVASHSFSVVYFLHLLTEGTASAKLLMAGLTHDLAEHVAGDMPSPSKRALGIGAELNAMEEGLLETHGLHFLLSKKDTRTLKLADMMSGLLFCVTERALGNKLIDEVYARFHAYISELVPTGVELEVLNALVTRWEGVQ